ncbi:MAG: hypothetical protein SAL70_02595 [Scytonema sp. PMC 1070.18]|nr:hypothetical protein [Scytonema sp. PMC 1070.18]
MPDTNNQDSNGSRNSQASTNNHLLTDIEQLSQKAENNLSEPELANLNISVPPADFNLEECWYKAKLFEAATKRAEEEAQKARGLNEQRRQLETQRQELEQQRLQLNQEKDELQRTRAELYHQERELHERELNAEAGFIQQNRSALDKLEEQTQGIRQELEQFYKTISQERQALIDEINQQRAKFTQEIAAELQEIEANRNQLAEERKQLRLEQRRVETERQLLEEDKQALEEKIEQKTAVKEETLKTKIRVLEQQLEKSRELQRLLETQLIQRLEANKRFGQKTPEEVLEELETLRSEKAELEQKLALRLGESAAARLQELESQKQEWETERFRLSTRLQELERSITYNRIAVTELETLRDEKEALEASNNRIRAALDELKAQVNEAVAQSQERSPFPECFRMDGDTRLQTEILLCENIPDLKEFARDLRSRIALSPLMQDENTEKRLYYSERDIRVFLGGLAMSHLHILQGISGTGKTSLPIAFSRAMGGQYKLVEVQAGWRDRQDLIGYFNTFEGRFYESDFFKALYEAQCPANRESIYIIILDEMNLSRPEQYFADFLSKLEQDAPTIGLTTDLDKPSPQLFQQRNILSIPPNVWFVGTANQDETTLEFADKTYDRSHIMELQRSYETFNLPSQLEPKHPISYEALTNSFRNAQRRYANTASEAYQFLNETLAEFLERQFKVGWGNRLERQIKNFVPVVIAAGGSLGEACDHILATKILRKIRDRYDTPTSDLRKLKDELLAGWDLHQFAPEPKQSIDIIDKEIRRLEPGEN